MPTNGFQKFVAQFDPVEPRLPLVHSTDYTILAAIASDGCLAATTDAMHPKENILHLFYARPSYDPAHGQGPRSDVLYCPVCVVLKPKCITVAKRIFPFDSGAFGSGFFRRYLHKTMKKNDFCLGSSMDVLPRVVKAFFGSNQDYYLGFVKSDLKIGFLDLTVQAYYNIITARGQAEADDRRSSIEVQLGKNVTLSGNTLAVILPAAPMDDYQLRHKIEDVWKAEVLRYPFYGIFNSSSYKMAVFNIILWWLEKQGYF